jgi:hypothetical protein
MPLAIKPLFKFCSVISESNSERVVGDYHAGKPVDANEVVGLRLNYPVTQIIIQKGDKLRAARVFPCIFSMHSDNGTSYYLRVPVGYNGEIQKPSDVEEIFEPKEIKSLEDYLMQSGFKLSSFGNSRTIDVPKDFNPDKHSFVATDYWLRQNGFEPR